MKTYKVQVNYTTHAVVEVDAESMKEAVNIASIKVNSRQYDDQIANNCLVKSIKVLQDR